MANLVLNRDYVLTSLFGHSINFKKGVPTYVPNVVYHEAISIGAQHEDGSAPEVLKQESSNKAPTDPLERSRLIMMAIEDLVARNDRRDFTAAGSPSVKAVEREVGFDVDSREVQGMWQKYHEDKAAK